MAGRFIFTLLWASICMGLLAAARPGSTATMFTAAKPGDIWRDPTTGMEFVWVEGGTYQMGCGAWSNDCGDYEKPVHEVSVSGFWIGKYSVTQEQWMKVIGNNPSHSKKGDNYPVEEVSWNDAKEFIVKLNSKSGYTFRLPTEAEFEYAARSGGKEELYPGGSNVDAVAWYQDNSGFYINAPNVFVPAPDDLTNFRIETHPVGTKAPNGLGIYDMSGNVFQWCEDIFDNDAYKKHQLNNPIYTDTGDGPFRYRVLRGCGFLSVSQGARCTARWTCPEDDRHQDIGFRLVRNP